MPDIDTISLTLRRNDIEMIIRRQDGQLDQPVTINLEENQQLVFCQPKDFYISALPIEAVSTEVVTSPSESDLATVKSEVVVKEEFQEYHSTGYDMMLGDLLETVMYSEDPGQELILQEGVRHKPDETVAAHLCRACGKGFTTPTHLKTHLRRHTGIKPYCCDFPGCTYCSADSSNLNHHKKKHSDVRYVMRCPRERITKCAEQSLRCGECDLSFTTSTHLQTHLRRHKGEKPFCCNFPGCSYSSADSSNLNHHKKKHSDVLYVRRRRDRTRKYAKSLLQCNECDKTFTTPTHLQTHLRRHNGEKPFGCNFPGCSYSSADSSNLNKHRKKHSIGIHYSCDVPDCTFSSLGFNDMKVHKQTHTGDDRYSCDLRNDAYAVI